MGRGPQRQSARMVRRGPESETIEHTNRGPSARMAEAEGFCRENQYGAGCARDHQQEHEGGE